MHQHQIALVSQHRKQRAAGRFHLFQGDRCRSQNLRALTRRQSPPGGPADPQHLVQDARAFQRQRHRRKFFQVVHDYHCSEDGTPAKTRGSRAKIELSMHPDTHLVIQLQSLDQKITALEKEVAALPKHIAAIEKTLESHVRKLEADRAALVANQKDRKKFEGDIQVNEQKISKLRDQMLGAKTNEQYRAFPHEIEFAEKEIRKAEDRILELMSESEPLDANVKKAEAALKEEKAVVESEKMRARERTAVDQAQLDQLHGERAESAAKLPAATRTAYDRIRKKRGIAIAEVVAERCTACQIQLRPQYMQDLRKGGELMLCESCGRFLYYNPPVSFEGVASVH